MTHKPSETDILKREIRKKKIETNMEANLIQKVVKTKRRNLSNVAPLHPNREGQAVKD
jgi:hypothetical protein